jgi:hypothetical protein
VLCHALLISALTIAGVDLGSTYDRWGLPRTGDPVPGDLDRERGACPNRADTSLWQGYPAPGGREAWSRPLPSPNRGRRRGDQGLAVVRGTGVVQQLFCMDLGEDGVPPEAVAVLDARFAAQRSPGLAAALGYAGLM